MQGTLAIGYDQPWWGIELLLGLSKTLWTWSGLKEMIKGVSFFLFWLWKCSIVSWHLLIFFPMWRALKDNLCKKRGKNSKTRNYVEYHEDN